MVAGTVYDDMGNYFLPVKILGEPLNSRSNLYVFTMNLQMIRISTEIDKNFEFDTIWPFVLYLFNNWVRHQVKLMNIASGIKKKKFLGRDSPQQPYKDPKMPQVYDLKPLESQVAEA